MDDGDGSQPKNKAKLIQVTNIGGCTSTSPRSALADARQVALRERGGRGEAAPARGSRLVEMEMMKVMVKVMIMMMMIVERGKGRATMLFARGSRLIIPQGDNILKLLKLDSETVVAVAVTLCFILFK